MYPPPPPPPPIPLTSTSTTSSHPQQPPSLARSQPSSSSTDTAISLASDSSSSTSGRLFTLKGLSGKSWGEPDEGSPAARGLREGSARSRAAERQNTIGPEHAYEQMMQIGRGSLAGKNMRFSLKMAQQPIHGRRKTEKDRRPLAHCPILRLRMVECKELSDGSYVEEEVDVVDLEPGHFVCAAELVEVEGEIHAVTDATHDPPTAAVPTYRHSAQTIPTRGRHSPRVANSGEDTTMQSSSSPSPPHRSSSWAADGIAGVSAPGASRYAGTTLDSSVRDPTSASSSTTATPMTNTRNPFIVPSVTVQSHVPSLRTGQQRTAGNRSSGSSGDGDSVTAKPVNKRPKPAASRNLYGSLHVPAARVVAPEGDFGLWFLFTDLTVREEGTYALRFRVFDITAANRSTRSAAPLLIETTSQAFKVYSPRNFPGLPKPTDIAEHFGKQGFKLNTRKNERQAKTPPPESSFSSGGKATIDQLSPKRPEPAPLQHSPALSASKAGKMTNTDRTAISARSRESSGQSTASSGLDNKGRVEPSPLSRSLDD